MEDQLPSPRNHELISPRSLVLLGVLLEGGLVLLALVLGPLLGCPPVEVLFRWTLRAAALGAAASLPMLVLLLAGMRLPIWPFSDIRRVFDELLVPLFGGCRVVDLAVISALAGLGEEMLFRGVVQEAISRWADGPSGTWIGLAVAAVLFGLVHCITLTYTLMAGLIGFYLGWLWIATDNLLVPVMAHAVYDFLALVYLVRIRRRGPPAADDEPPTSDQPESRD